MNIKKYKVEHTPTGVAIKVEIDFDFISVFRGVGASMNTLIEVMVDFWSGSDVRLSENNDKYLETFLKQLCEKSLSIVLEHNVNLEGLLKHFEKQDGYCRMDGSEGIRITSLEAMQLHDQGKYDITELESITYNSPSNN